jgi:hypothetical protein
MEVSGLTRPLTPRSLSHFQAAGLRVLSGSTAHGVYTGMTIELKRFRAPIAGVTLIVLALATSNGLDAAIREEPRRVHALFEPGVRSASPFPSDLFTVADAGQATGRRMNLPFPDCTVRPSDCQDLHLINTLDGFGLQTRISVPFDGAINPSTVSSDTVFVISRSSTLPGGEPGGKVIGITQIIWDPDTFTLHVEVNEILEQHREYALVVTEAIQDQFGRAIKASKEFKRFRNRVPTPYAARLEDVLAAAETLGVSRSDIVVASVFTTQSVTPVMERIRDAIKDQTPARANFQLGPAGQRSVYRRASVASIVLIQQTRVSPPAFASATLPLAPLDVVPGAIATIAHGSYRSPVYIERPAGSIPTVGTLSGVPPVQTHDTIYFTIYLPSGAKPASGWPVVIAGASGSRHQIQSSIAAFFASRGIATIGIGAEGFGFGPLGSLQTTFTDGTSSIIPDAGRSYDQDGNDEITGNEGSTAAANRLWTIGESDPQKQTAIDLLQLVRLIEIGMDVDGDAVADLDAAKISYHGQSGGGRFGSILAALDPSVRVLTISGCCGISPEHGRWAPMRRPGLGRLLASRVPSLLNADGLTSIDGVGVAAPFYNENKPLRNQPALINTVPGAIDIQEAFEIHEWGQQTGQTSHTWMLHLRKRPLAGMAPKAVGIYVFKADQQTVNPSATEALADADLLPNTLYYRHDWAFDRDPAIPKNPHLVVVSPTAPNALFRSVSRGAQAQIADFHASGGLIVNVPEPAVFWEVPMFERPDSLNFIQ